VTGLLFLVLLASALSFVLVRGGRDEKAVVLALLAAALATAANYAWMGRSFGTVQPVLLASEACVLALCLAIAFRSRRHWPLVVSSLQLATVLSLLAPLFGRNLVSDALGVFQGLWAYLQLVVLVLAVLRTPAHSRPMRGRR